MAAMLAVLCQIVALLMPMPVSAAIELNADLVVICHAAEGGTTVPDGKRVPASDACHLCPACLASLPSITPAPSALPTPPVRFVEVTPAPVSTGPGFTARRFNLQPRAPPATV